MKVLILGGTEFAGRALADEAQRRGASVTTLNRGRHPAVPGAITLTGDRTRPDGLAALPDDTWDAVLDTWSGAPYVVRDSARTLAGRARQYVYVSSISAYQYPPVHDLAESAPMVAASADDGADGREVIYPQAKRGAELAVLEAFGDRACLIRPGLILGPHENIGRLTWWLGRIARGGTIPAPGPADLPLQYLDVRDLAIFVLDGVEQGRSGAYNLASPPGITTMGELLATCADVTGSGGRLHWLSPELILDRQVSPWVELPIWLPPGEDHEAMMTLNVSRALAAGLTCRPVRDTVAGTWAWQRTLAGAPPSHPDRPAPGLSPEAEARLLAP